MARCCVQLVLLVCILGAAAAAPSSAAAAAAAGSPACPPCGKFPVPYPLSTSASCGHPRYKITCTAQKTLQVQALSGTYTVQSLDPNGTRTMVIYTGAFLGDSCIAEELLSTHNFSLDPSSTFFIAPSNTVMLLNTSDFLRMSPVLKCTDQSPCVKALTVVPQKSCRGSPCCSFTTDTGTFFKYGFPVSGAETGYVSVLGLVDPNSDPARWKFGLRLEWEVPHEPPCTTQAQCGGCSTCTDVPPVAPASTVPLRACLCNHGHIWDPVTGTCPKAPYCVRNGGSVACHKVQYATGLTFGIAGLIAFTALTIYMYKKWRVARRTHAKLVKERCMILATDGGGRSARLFSKKEMKRATNGFARDRVLGCGGFGEVFKGDLHDKTVVAIKLAKMGNLKGTDQILNEVRILSQVNHRSLVRLLGCCVESKLPLLVYEYVPNGNLYDHLASKKGTLDWKMRLRIGLQSAEGLAYLHSAAYPPIYHRDVKSSNILLDISMNARVADFGLSRLAKPDLTHISTCVQGTFGYLDPEYYRNFQVTDKSDVYSFGVVLLELVTSQKAIDFTRGEDDVSLVAMVEICKDEGKVDNVLDPNLVEGASKETVNSMRCVVNLALECLHENRLNRPSMKEVVERLEQIISSLEVVERAAREKNNGCGYNDA